MVVVQNELKPVNADIHKILKKTFYTTFYEIRIQLNEYYVFDLEHIMSTKYKYLCDRHDMEGKHIPRNLVFINQFRKYLKRLYTYYIYFCLFYMAEVCRKGPQE